MIKRLNIAGIMLVIMMVTGCSSNAYVSQQASQEFITDGKKNEWQGRFNIIDGQSFALGVSHSKNYLYVAINSIDRDFMRQISMGGLTLWLDVKGGNRENLGIKFEGALPGERRSGMSRRDTYGYDEETGAGFRTDRSSALDGDLTLIVMDKKEGKSMGPADLLASINSIDETLFIEYQIPLSMLGQDFNMAKLGLGLESRMDRPGMSGGRPGGMKAGGGRSGGMSSGGGRAGGMGGSRQGGPPSGAMSQAGIEVWAKIEFPQ